MSKYRAFDTPIHHRQLRRLEDVQGLAAVVGHQQRPVGQEPRRDGVGRRFDEELDRLAAPRLVGQHELPVPVVQALHRAGPGVPDLALGGEAHHLVPAEVDEGRHLGPDPVARGSNPGTGTRWCPTCLPTGRPR